jgi:hypothetical protein
MKFKRFFMFGSGLTYLIIPITTLGCNTGKMMDDFPLNVRRWKKTI